MANTTLQVRKSGITGNVPSSLEFGELALNYADGKLYYRDATDNISYISTDTTTDSFATINANSSLILATSPTDTLSILPGNNITISADVFGKSITINSTATGGGGGGGANVEIVNDVSSNATRYISFTDSTSGNVSTLYTSDDKLIYNPSTGTVRLNALEVTANTNISANTKVITGTSPNTLDSFSADQYRGAFYQVQMEAGGSFHVLNLSVVNSGGAAQVSSFGDAYNSGSLATFSATVTGGQVILTITPVSGETTVSFLRHALVRLTIGVPVGDLGWIGEAVTNNFDAGFDGDPATSSFDYGYLS
jgi:hypothetical protein